jgi:Porin subfamily
VDVRQQTEYGTLRTYFRTGIQVTTPGDGEGGNVFIDRAFIQFAGFTVGKTQSFFDLFTYGGGMSYHNVRTAGDTGALGTTLWAYTAQFGNGFSGTLSLESPNGHNSAFNAHSVVDVTQAGFFGYGTLIGDNAFAHQAAAAQNGFRVPDIVVNLRVDQAWGFFGISGALHEASGQYYLTPNVVNNGHPADKLGWAGAVGGQLNLQGGDQIGMNFCYSEGNGGYCTNAGLFGKYDSSNSVGVGWIANGIFDTGTAVELTRVWSINAGYQHIWSPKWRTSLYGGYVNIDYNGAATNIINSHFDAAGKAACGVTALPGANTFTYINARAGNSCNPDWSFWSVGTRTQFNPVPQLDIGLDLLYTHLNSAYKGAAVVAATGARPAIAGLNVIDDQDVLSAFFRWQRNFYP